MSAGGPGSADGGSPALALDARRVVERLLADAWGEPVGIVTAAVVADRSHVVRVVAGDGRSAVVKRPRRDTGGRWGLEPQGFATEWASLEFLSAMSDAVVPRLWGSDLDHQVVVMEDLAVERTLADSLLGPDVARARADVVAYAEALGAIHAWSIGRAAEHSAVRRAHGMDDGGGGWWVRVIGRQRSGFLAAAADLGIGLRPDRAGPAIAAQIDAEIDTVERLLDGGRRPGFVHGDPCPDNVVVVDGGCRLVDFERSSPGSVALDVAYLIAPFPSCWCFAQVPPDLASEALATHRRVLAGHGVTLDDDWDLEVAAALAGWVVARGADIARALDDDRPWGTATMRPRLLAWMGAFLASTSGADAFPRLHTLVGDLRDRLRAVWPDVAVPHYPGLVPPGVTAALLAVAPDGWSPVA